MCGQCGYGPLRHIGHFLKGFLGVWSAKAQDGFQRPRNRKKNMGVTPVSGAQRSKFPPYPPQFFLNSRPSRAPKTILCGQCGYGPLGHIGHFLKGFLGVWSGKAQDRIPEAEKLEKRWGVTSGFAANSHASSPHSFLNSWLSKLPVSDHVPIVHGWV